MATTADDTAVTEKIAELPAFRDVAARLHRVILDARPGLVPRLWYGMPGYATSKKGPVLCFFRVDDDRYVTFGLSGTPTTNPIRPPATSSWARPGS